MTSALSARTWPSAGLSSLGVAAWSCKHGTPAPFVPYRPLSWAAFMPDFLP